MDLLKLRFHTASLPFAALYRLFRIVRSFEIIRPNARRRDATLRPRAKCDRRVHARRSRAHASKAVPLSRSMRAACRKIQANVRAVRRAHEPGFRQAMRRARRRERKRGRTNPSAATSHALLFGLDRLRRREPRRRHAVLEQAIPHRGIAFVVEAEHTNHVAREFDGTDATGRDHAIIGDRE